MAVDFNPVVIDCWPLRLCSGRPRKVEARSPRSPKVQVSTPLDVRHRASLCPGSARSTASAPEAPRARSNSDRWKRELAVALCFVFLYLAVARGDSEGLPRIVFTIRPPTIPSLRCNDASALLVRSGARVQLAVRPALSTSRSFTRHSNSERGRTRSRGC